MKYERTTTYNTNARSWLKEFCFLLFTIFSPNPKYKNKKRTSVIQTRCGTFDKNRDNIQIVN